MGFLKSVSTYALVGFLSAGVNFFLMPYLSHFLSPGDYGILAIFNSYVTLLIPFIGLVAASLITVEFYRIKDEKEFASLFSSVQLIPIIPFLVFFIGCVFFPNELTNWLDIEPDSSYWLFSIPVLGVLTVYTDSFFSFLIIEKKSTLYAVFNILKLIVEVSLTILFVTYYALGWQGRMLSWVITTVLFLLISVIYFGKHNLWTTRIQRKYVMAGIAYGTPLILHTVGKFVINQSDRLFIAKMISPAEAGIYSSGYQVGSIMLIIITAINGVITPFIFERLSDLNSKKEMEIVRMSYFFIGVLLCCIIGIAVAAPFYFSWFMDSRYLGGERYVFWVAFGYFFWGIYMIFAGYLYFVKKTAVLAKLAVVNVITNILFNYFFITIYGPLGAAYATCLSFAIVAACVMVVSTKYYALPWFDFQSILKTVKHESHN